MNDSRKSIPGSSLFNRRGFLSGAGATLLYAAIAGQTIPRFAKAQSFADYPFTLGVASGDPTPNGVVLWTRLAPQPLVVGGGMPQKAVAVRWQVALDENMSRVVQRGAVLAVSDLAHSVHVEVRGLHPGRWYWYQFTVGDVESPIGRTRTAPDLHSRQNELRFAFVSCQHYTQGLYPAHKRLAEEDLDFAVHLGDYIYETAATGVRTHQPATEIMSLDDYRIRYAQYKSDPSLQAVHAAFPWLVVWDDHETENDYAGLIPQDAADQPTFEERRARAYQVYYEHMPLRSTSLPIGSSLQLYRRLHFGNMAQINMLDTRQYRSARAPANCDLAHRVDGYCPDALDPSRTITGDAQRDWLLAGLDRSYAHWNILANQVPFAPNDTNADPAIRTFGGEKWDGYPFDRSKVLNFLAARKLTNTVVITGDVHVNYVRNVPPDYVHLDAEPVATEFIGTSISSGGDRTISTVTGGNVNNPHLQFTDNHHGYVRCTLTPDLWRSDYRVVPTVLEQDAPISTLASFVVERSRAGALPD